MKKICTIVATTLAALTLCPLALHAQEDASLQQQDTYSRLFDAMESGVDQDVVLDSTVALVVNQMMIGNPSLAAAAEEHPGLGTALGDAMRPILRQYSQRVNLEYRPRMVEAAREVLTEEEAISLADFYNSDVGRRLMQAVSGNLTLDSMFEEGMSGQGVSAEAVNRDMNETGERAVGELSEEDQASLFATAMTTPGYNKLPQLQERVAPIRAEMESTPPTAEENAAIVQAITSVGQQFGL